MLYSTCGVELYLRSCVRSCVNRIKEWFGHENGGGMMQTFVNRTAFSPHPCMCSIDR